MVYHFSKTMQPIKAYLRSLGIPIWIYIDDAIVLGKTRELCHRNRAIFRAILQRSGFVESIAKATEPCQVAVFVGLTIDTKNRLVSIPEDKMARILDALSVILKKNACIIREMAKAVGLIMSALLAVGPALILLCRPIYCWIKEASSYEELKPVGALRGHLVFLRSALPRLHGYPFQVDEARQPIEVAFSSDASGTGRAVIALSCTLDDDHTDHDGPCGLPISVLSILSFTVAEMRLSSTWRELKALEDLYCISGHLYKGKRMLHLTDSKAVEGIMKKGSRHDHL